MKTRGLIGLIAMIASVVMPAYAMAEQRMMQMVITLPVEILANGKTLPAPQPEVKKPAVEERESIDPTIKRLESVVKRVEKAAVRSEKAASRSEASASIAVKATEEMTKKIDLFSREVIDRIATKKPAEPADPPRKSLNKKEIGHKFLNCAASAAAGYGAKNENVAVGASGGVVLVLDYTFKKEINWSDFAVSVVCGTAGYFAAPAPTKNNPSIVVTTGGGNPITPPTTTPDLGTGTGPVLPPPVP